MFWGLICLLKDPRVECLTWGTDLLLLREKFHIFEILPNSGSLYLGWDFGKSMSLPLLPISVWPFILSC